VEPSTTTTKAFRVPEALKARIEAAQGDQPAVDFWESILVALESQADEQGEKPTTQEAQTVRRALGQVEQVVLAALRLAEEARVQASQTVATIRAEASEGEAQAKEEIKALKIELTAAGEDFRRAAEEVAQLKVQAENVTELKTLWKERETGLLERIAALDTEAAETRKIKDDLAQARADLTAAHATAKDLQHTLDLHAKDLSAAQKEAASYSATLAGLKTELDNERQAHTATRTDLEGERQAHAVTSADLATATATVQGLREALDVERQAHQQDRQALEEERKALGKAQVDLATALAQVSYKEEPATSPQSPERPSKRKASKKPPTAPEGPAG